jgi:hypothetical protein
LSWDGLFVYAPKDVARIVHNQKASPRHGKCEALEVIAGIPTREVSVKPWKPRRVPGEGTELRGLTDCANTAGTGGLQFCFSEPEKYWESAMKLYAEADAFEIDS